MAHTLKLGFKQNPSGTDDYIDIGGSLNTVVGSIRPGYYLKSYTESTSTRTDQYGRQVRDITLVCDIQGSSVDDAHFKFKEINRFLQRTRMYLEHFNGNIPAQTNLEWHTGRAATLSFQAQAAGKVVYWDILDGVASLPASAFLAPENNSNFAINSVTVKLTCNYVNREAVVILDNPLPMGDFEPPFKITTTTTDPTSGGWNTNASHTFDTATYKFGTRSLKWSGTGSGSWTTPTIRFADACTIVISIWVKGTVTGGSGNYTISYSKNGGAAVNIQVFAVGASVSTFTQYSSSPISIVAADTLSMSGTATAGGGTVFGLNFDGAAFNRNPTGSVAPTEYFATGRDPVVPTGNVYGVRGDVEAPFVMSLNHTNVNGGSGLSRYLLLGINPIKWGTDYPLLGLDLQTANGTASNFLFYGAQGNSVSGSPLTGVSTFALTGASLGRTVGGRPRKYRAFLVYAAYRPSGIGATLATITLGKDVKNYVVDLIGTPAMTAGNTPASGNYGLYDLGDLLFPRPGNMGIERSFVLSISDNIKVDFTGSGLTRFFLGGVLLIPAEQFIYIDLGTSTGTDQNYPIISNESTAVKVQLGQQNVTYPSVAGYQATGMLSELNSFNSSAYFTADGIELEPGDTHFEMFTAASFQSAASNQSGYFYDWDKTILQPTILYAPRNLTAAV